MAADTPGVWGMLPFPRRQNLTPGGWRTDRRPPPNGCGHRLDRDTLLVSSISFWNRWGHRMFLFRCSFLFSFRVKPRRCMLKSRKELVFFTSHIASILACAFVSYYFFREISVSAWKSEIFKRRYSILWRVKGQWLLYISPCLTFINSFCFLPVECICLFYVDLRTNGDYFPTTQRWVTGFYSLDSVLTARYELNVYCNWGQFLYLKVNVA